MLAWVPWLWYAWEHYGQNKDCIRQNFPFLQRVGNGHLQGLNTFPHLTSFPSECRSAPFGAAFSSISADQHFCSKRQQKIPSNKAHWCICFFLWREWESKQHMLSISHTAYYTSVRQWANECSERIHLNRPEGPHSSLRLPLTHLFSPSFSDCSSWRRGKSIPFLNVFLVAQITVSWGASQGVPSGLKMAVILGQYVSGPEWN